MRGDPTEGYLRDSELLIYTVIERHGFGAKSQNCPLLVQLLARLPQLARPQQVC